VAFCRFITFSMSLMLLSFIFGRLFIMPADYAPAVLTDVVAWDDVVPTTSEWCEAIG
jgi:ABC-type polysaccharide/polyol phosphate export permease